MVRGEKKFKKTLARVFFPVIFTAPLPKREVGGFCATDN
jgi:hypothetical protein